MTKGRQLNRHLFAAQRACPLPQENSRCPEPRKSTRLPSVLLLASQTPSLDSYVFCFMPPASCLLPPAVRRLPPASCSPPSASSFYSSLFTHHSSQFMRKAQRQRSAVQ